MTRTDRGLASYLSCRFRSRVFWIGTARVDLNLAGQRKAAIHFHERFLDPACAVRRQVVGVIVARMNPSTTLRGGMVGCGYFAQFHIEAWRRIPGVDLAARRIRSWRAPARQPRKLTR